MIRKKLTGKGLKKGDCVMALAVIKHNEISCPDDFEALEILSPAKHETVKV